MQMEACARGMVICKGYGVIKMFKTCKQVMEQLPSLHVTHILDVEDGVEPFSLPENLPGLEIVFERRGQRIYRVK